MTHKQRMAKQIKDKENKIFLRKEISRLEEKINKVNQNPSLLEALFSLPAIKEDLREEKRRLREIEGHNANS